MQSEKCSTQDVGIFSHDMSNLQESYYKMTMISTTTNIKGRMDIYLIQL